MYRTVIYGELMIGNSWGFPNDKNTGVFNLYTRLLRDLVVSE